MALPKTGTLPDHGLTIEPGGHPASAGAILGVDYSAGGLDQQQMIAQLDKYVTAHGGTLVGVQFNPADATKGFFVVTTGTAPNLVAQQYTFSINTHTNVVTVTGPFPWQL